MTSEVQVIPAVYGHRNRSPRPRVPKTPPPASRSSRYSVPLLPSAMRRTEPRCSLPAAPASLHRHAPRRHGPPKLFPYDAASPRHSRDPAAPVPFLPSRSSRQPRFPSTSGPYPTFLYGTGSPHGNARQKKVADMPYAAAVIPAALQCLTANPCKLMQPSATPCNPSPSALCC